MTAVFLARIASLDQCTDPPAIWLPNLRLRWGLMIPLIVCAVEGISIALACPGVGSRRSILESTPRSNLGWMTLHPLSWYTADEAVSMETNETTDRGLTSGNLHLTSGFKKIWNLWDANGVLL